MSLTRVNSLLRDVAGELSEGVKKIGWDFDLSDFKDAQAWKDFIAKLGIKRGKKIVKEHTLPSGSKYTQAKWRWATRGLVIETNANPLTGEKSSGGHNEPGYASYVHFEGDPAKVKSAVAQFRKDAQYIKGSRKGEMVELD